ncbi:MAG: 4-hydroxythreonine-4-phosphate dehydrogenase PdxA [Sphaerochaeta sp.]
MSESHFPYLALPGGDPAGIGVEILLKALRKDPTEATVGLIVITDGPLLQKSAADLALETPFVITVTNLAELQEAVNRRLSPILFSQTFVDLSTFAYGVINAQCGLAAYEAIKVAVEVVQAGIAQAIVTPPLHKEALRAAGIDEIGHTEILSTLTGTTKAVTMFETHGLKIFFHSRHLSLREACDAVTYQSLLETIIECEAITCSNPQGFDLNKPLAVAALNPHGGDGGLFGREEIEHIIPAIEEAQKHGINVVGPIGADSVFHQGRIGMWRAVISLYHDQGHIAAKTYDFNQTISITWGLPFLRTSVDHGTAFDIAGKNIADASGMVRAIEVAAQYLTEGI